MLNVPAQSLAGSQCNLLKARLSDAPACGFVQNLNNVVGDIVVAAGAIAYSGPFTPAFRQSLQQEWTAVLQTAGVPHTPDTNLIDTLQVCGQLCQHSVVLCHLEFGGGTI